MWERPKTPKLALKTEGSHRQEMPEAPEAGQDKENDPPLSLPERDTDLPIP